MQARRKRHVMRSSVWMNGGIYCSSLISRSRMIESESYLLGKPRTASDNAMKIEKLKKRLDRNRPMTTVTLRMPEDVADDLKRIAPLLGFSGYQPLMRAY